VTLPRSIGSRLAASTDRQVPATRCSAPVTAGRCRRPGPRLLPVFLTWAKQQHHLPAALTVAATPAWQLGAVQPADQRRQLALKLLHDDTLPAADRAAGLLVLLSSRTLTRISRLRRADLATDPGSGVV